LNVASFFLAVVLVCSIVGLVFLLAFLGKTDTDTFKILVGALMSVGFTNVIGFYFGSSQSSKNKDETITAMATGTGTGAGIAPAIIAAAKAVAPAAAAVAAPPAADVAAPPAAEVAVAEALAKRDEKKP
jgi:Na+/citrate or Na+/malate symporter